ncbi:unnamed protein product, partial [Symbiodinium sp. KB8]
SSGLSELDVGSHAADGGPGDPSGASLGLPDEELAAMGEEPTDGVSRSHRQLWRTGVPRGSAPR